MPMVRSRRDPTVRGSLPAGARKGRRDHDRHHKSQGKRAPTQARTLAEELTVRGPEETRRLHETILWHSLPEPDPPKGGNGETSGHHARATATSSSLVVYRGERLSCRPACC